MSLRSISLIGNIPVILPFHRCSQCGCRLTLSEVLVKLWINYYYNTVYWIRL